MAPLACFDQIRILGRQSEVAVRCFDKKNDQNNNKKIYLLPILFSKMFCSKIEKSKLLTKFERVV